MTKAEALAEIEEYSYTRPNEISLRNLLSALPNHIDNEEWDTVDDRLRKLAAYMIVLRGAPHD